MGHQGPGLRHCLFRGVLCQLHLNLRVNLGLSKPGCFQVTGRIARLCSDLPRSVAGLGEVPEAEDSAVLHRLGLCLAENGRPHPAWKHFLARWLLQGLRWGSWAQFSALFLHRPSLPSPFIPGAPPPALTVLAQGPEGRSSGSRLEWATAVNSGSSHVALPGEA